MHKIEPEYMHYFTLEFTNEAALVSIFSRVELFSPSLSEKYYQPKILNIDRETLFPTSQNKVSPGSYNNLWESFVSILNKLRRIKYRPCDFVTFYFILKKLGTFIPSATPWEEEKHARTVPDVSLFDHSRLTCAIAACLCELSDELSNNEMSELIQILRQYRKPEFEKILSSSPVANKEFFLLVRGDIAGIQKFVYSVTKPQVEPKGTAKRLRGKSFYVTLLGEVISDWIRRKFNLPITNILFCEGGRFDLLLPCSALIKEKLEEMRSNVDKWLLDEFRGELSIQIVNVPIKPADFFDFSDVYLRAEETLNKEKQHKFSKFINEENFYTPVEHFRDVCPACGISPIKGTEKICSQCEVQLKIGSNLPRSKFMVYRYTSNFEQKSRLNNKTIPFPKFGVKVLFLENEEDVKRIIRKSKEDRFFIYLLNSTDFLKSVVELREENQNVGAGFKFIANSVPFIEREGRVLDFEEIAKLSDGAKNLGILKIDIDNLGLIFGLGIEPISCSRIFTLSSFLSIFFTGWINSICSELSKKWKNEKLGDLSDESEPKTETIKNIKNVFYTIYSGGDDLLIVGPWNQIIELAQIIHKDFNEYTCNNPNITLSGGILIVKPHFPVQRFSKLVEEELRRSKYEGKNKITLWGETLDWTGGKKSFSWLISYGKRILNQVKDPVYPLPKSFLYYLLRLEKLYIKKDKENLIWIPYFIYALKRRIIDEIEDKLSFRSEIMDIRGNLKIPISYVSLRARKED